MKKFLMAGFLALSFHQPVPANVADERDPMTIVNDATRIILDKLNSNRQSYVDNPELLREVVQTDLVPLMDLEYSARLILGKSGRDISAEQLRAFADAMSGVLVNRYANGLLEFKAEEQMEVLPMKGKNTEKLTRVRTRIKLPSGAYAPVDYAFRMTDQGWKAFDVTVEGISYVLTFRNQISPRVEQDGIDKVTADILAGNVKLNEE